LMVLNESLKHLSLAYASLRPVLPALAGRLFTLAANHR
jgi:hypothetical protein